MTDARPPLVLVVDDEFGLPELLELRADTRPWAKQYRDRRRAWCDTFGLSDALVPAAGAVPRDCGLIDEAGPAAVGRAAFLSCLEWIDDSARLNPELLLARLAELQQLAPPGPVLLLLDLQFNYGQFDVGTGTFPLRHMTYGTDFILPLLKKRFGEDSTGGGQPWTRYPAVVVSGLSKVTLDPIVRQQGARGMLAKHGWSSPIEARERLQSYITAHGLLPDNRGLIVGDSLALLNVLAAARRAASASSVLLLGESGTGKELLARYIHDHSRRAHERYGVYHAAGRSEELQEDELFGHWRGAYTGAQWDQPGLLEQCNGGTVLIDEIGDISPRVQSMLMRPLQERVIRRIGRHEQARDIALDLTFVFATNKDLSGAVDVGAFRLDLKQRIEQVSLQLPPLRERLEDLPSLSSALLARIDTEVSRGTVRHQLDEAALAVLAKQAFASGNVRELRNVLLRAVLAHPLEPRLTESDVRPHASVSGTAIATVPTSSSHEPIDTATRDIQAPGMSRASDAVSALSQWLTSAPDHRPLTEARALARRLAGSAPRIIVSLLEVACQSCDLDGHFSLPRMMTRFWGAGDVLTSQQARRLLDRVLTADWGGRAVAAAARQSPILMAQPLVKRAVESALRQDSE